MSLVLRVVEIPPLTDVDACVWDGDVYFPPVNGQSMTTFGTPTQDSSVNECYAVGSIPINLGATAASIYVAGVNGDFGGREFRVEVLESIPGNQYTLPDDSALNQRQIFYGNRSAHADGSAGGCEWRFSISSQCGASERLNSLPFFGPIRAEWGYQTSASPIAMGHSNTVTLVYLDGPNPAIVSIS